MKVPLLDLKKQYEKIREEVDTAVDDVCNSQQFILGPNVEKLEIEIAEYCGCRYAVGVSSGTDALLISLMSAGVGPDDIVITTPYTFFATVGAIARTGARPVFVDIDEKTYNMDPVKLEAVLNSMDKDQASKLKAIIPVHLYGQCSDMTPILKVADNFGLTVIEDAAQAIGSECQFHDGSIKRAGSMGTYGCFSFFPSKNLGAFGDGGMVTTSNAEIFDRLKILRVHGSQPKYYHTVIGGNFRLDAIQAAILLVKLKYLDEWTEKRRENANLYRKLFQEKKLTEVVLPFDASKRHIYNQFVIEVKDRRDALRKHLTDNEIGSEIYYPVPLHMQQCFKYLGYKSEQFPVSVKAAENTIALPIYPELAKEQIGYVVDMISVFYKN
ncbi:MAG: DegT/DnrJ/EryC1/StrS family aminotransferase [Deltaproteobacteria bacterium]|nr:DegT/DnrJ/EryC1/StrS family aminotransferase [Deltaproteobacteria bacterium]